MSEQLLSVDKLGVDFTRRRTTFTALEEITFSIAEGETVGLVGESGSGKTTIGRSILGLVPPTRGTLTFRGEDITHASRAKRRELSRDMQVVFQDPYTSLNPSLTIEGILAEPLRAQGIDRREAGRRVKELLDRVRLPSDAAGRLPREFSGGQRQRVAIARALALRPRLIVCDEPVSALDLTTQQRVLDLFIEIQRDTGCAYLFVSHDLSVIRHVSHRVIVLNRGKIVESGGVEKVTSDPDDPYTQRLMMSAPLPDPGAQRERREELEKLRVDSERAA
ncbi:dipeptide/oligopeptide/nickel ABC transporter ATP-binding protein [Agreia sp. PsM10]|jgi:ABC-type glutathione transport system ATPase component|uniref:ATP-binding cassette domain-containing protein n=1 Tax=Agreia sp. PsM10 TaxID=3030533 RepID=UPI00263B624F|nr:dipeptide/oligopeptide/nickel ABC transporter ATP-binding protein [Agreia sp. PsM10]MDN4642197.1 dipeptide/oligopeptide/nickel ABC transporter ATP-binding protein [Agreia sp. PsM10]